MSSGKNNPRHWKKKQSDQSRNRSFYGILYLLKIFLEILPSFHFHFSFSEGQNALVGRANPNKGTVNGRSNCPEYSRKGASFGSANARAATTTARKEA
jgi:hypothetical protein